MEKQEAREYMFIWIIIWKRGSVFPSKSVHLTHYKKRDNIKPILFLILQAFLLCYIDPSK